MSNEKTDISSLTDLLSGEKRLVFVPNVGNLGDALIAHATYSFFRENGIDFTVAQVTEDIRGACVLIGGGGNLIEGRYNDMSNFLKRCGTHNRTVVLPHTIVGNIDLWHSLQSNVYVFARERHTQRFLTSIGLDKQVCVSDDMAFCLAGRLSVASPRAGTSLICLRRDSESGMKTKPPEGNLDVSGLMLHDWADALVAKCASEMFLAIVGEYERILTDRLHVAIAGYLLGREVRLLPNAYFKNRAVYESSLAHAPNVQFLDIEAL